MSHGSNSDVTNNGQSTFEQEEAKNIATENENKVKAALDYLESILPKSSPIPIPHNATIKSEHKKNGYEQVKYTWTEDGYKYTSRWHTHTPNAPDYSQETWVVEREKAGIGSGKYHRPKVHEVMIGKDSWVDWKLWHNAVKARGRKSETEEQRELLDNGHWKA